MSEADIRQRKVDHIELCAREAVEFRLKTTLLEGVHLIHDALPELAVDDLDMSVEVFGKRLRAPLVITGMTGGAERAREINRQLAAVAERGQVAFGVGSQRAMIVRPETAATYRVRDVAPTALILGNLGVVQAREMSTAQVDELVDAIGADALCVHLNPAQELIQVDGDRDFRGCVEALARLGAELAVPVIVKETGCGLSPARVRQLASLGLGAFDLSGAGGTTWVGVEALRARPGRRAIGEDFWEWGIPTGAAVGALRDLEVIKIASGGLRDGHDLARALALGATLGGMALPFLRAVDAGGVDGAQAHLDRVASGLEVAMLLTGSRDLAALREAPRVLDPALTRWIDALRAARSADI